MEKLALDLGAGDAFPAQEPQAELDRDYSVMPEPEGTEYYWVLTGTHIFVSEETRTEDYPLDKHLNKSLPYALGKVKVIARWTAYWMIQESNMATHMVEKRLRRYCKQQGWKFAGLSHDDGQLSEGIKTVSAIQVEKVLPYDADLYDEMGDMMRARAGGAYVDYEITPMAGLANPDGTPENYIDGPFFKRPRPGDPEQQVIFVHMLQGGNSSNDATSLMAYLRQLNLPIYSQVINRRLLEWLTRKFQASVPGAGDNWPQEKDWRRKEWGLDILPPDAEYFNITDPMDLDEPQGPQQCAFCHQLFPTWDLLMVHEDKVHQHNREPSRDWEPVVDYDQPLPADYNTLPAQDQTIMRQAAEIIPGPIPFVFDVPTDRIYIGNPGERVSDVQARLIGKFTPGGIVEGEYLPDGKLQILTDTDIPYSKRHMILVWQHMVPDLEVKNIIKVKMDGKKRKLATVESIGQKVVNVAHTDRAAVEAFNALRRFGTVYVVGGAVRDIILGRIPKDIDLMVQGVPADQVQKVLQSLPGRVDFTGKSFGVFRYKAPDGTEVEIALPREEMQGGNTNKDFQVDPFMPVEEDLLRRDFTGNAMAVNMATGELHMAPGTNGVEDLNKRKLRVVREQSFHEDPTRMLRAFTSVSKHGLTPDQQTLDMIQRNAHKLSTQPPERLQMDLDKLMSGDDPARAVRLMFDTGAMNHVIPELMAAYHFDQKNPHHRKVLHEHLLDVLRSVAEQTSDKDERMAALLHDVGKPASQWFSVKDSPEKKIWNGPQDGEPHGHYYYDPDLDIGGSHEEVGATMTRDILNRLKYPQKRIKRMEHLVQHHMFAPFDNERQARKRIKQVTPDANFPDEGFDYMRALLRLRRADSQGKGTDEWERTTPIDYQEQLIDQIQASGQATSLKDLKIGGKDLMALGIPAGPIYTQILNQLLQAVIDNPELNESNTLSQMAMQIANGEKTANILDPVRHELDPQVFDKADSVEPKVKKRINKWIHEKVFNVLTDAGWPDPHKYINLVLTGSLTTYQWSNTSDFDVSVWVDTNNLPEWQRSDMINLMVNQIDGTVVPGTTHPVQCYVVSSRMKREDLYRPGLRSAYDLDSNHWLVLPDRTRTKDVSKEFPAIIQYAKMMEDKMRLLLKYNPVGARNFWHQLHYRRHRDMAAGKGDFAESNIVYKWLANSGLFPIISETIGEYLAKTSVKKPSKFHTTLEDHHRSLKIHGPVRPHKKKTSAINPAYLDQYMQIHGPYMYHDTWDDAIPFILRDGLLPRTVTGAASDWDGDPSLESRPGHSYIGRGSYLDTIQGSGRGRGLRIDLRELDPGLIDSDEDHMQHLMPDPHGNLGWQPPEGYNSYGHWADHNSKLIDHPENVAHSLDRGSLAIRGGVPAHAISIDPYWRPPGDWPAAAPDEERWVPTVE